MPQFIITLLLSVLNALDFALQIKENASQRVCIFKISQGSMPRNPPRYTMPKAR